jgi:S1-C subfamily serine protease
MVYAKSRITSEYSSTWEGTGFIADLSKGLIITNAHVAGNMKSVVDFELKFGNGTKAEAKVIYVDRCYDIAILYVDPKDIPRDCIQLELTNEDVVINSKIWAMGDTWGNSYSTYQGIVFNRFGIVGLHEFPEQSFQFSGITSSGASGSPVFRSDGKVVGIIYGGGFITGAALPSSYILPILKAIQDGKWVERYTLGFTLDYKPLQELVGAEVIPSKYATEYQAQFPEANNQVLMVNRRICKINEKEKKTLCPGDVIISIDGVTIGCYLTKVEEILQKSQDKTIEARVYRNGEEKKVKIYPKRLDGFERFQLLSFEDAVLDETTDEVFGSTPGVRIAKAKSTSPFCSVPVLEVITSINGKTVKTLKDLFDIIPDLQKKQYLRVVTQSNDNLKSEHVTIVKHDPKTVEPATLVVFNPEKKAYGVRRTVSNRSNSED